LGRALGFGARAAAKTLVQAADAAMSPNPSAAKSNSQPKPAQPQMPAAASQPTSSPVPTPRQRAGNVVAATGKMGRTAWEPVKRHSRELWLQVTGSFFVLLACTMAGGMWALRNSVRAAFLTAHSHPAALVSTDALKFYVAALAFLMFAYFGVSNFVRASRSSAAARR